MAVRGASAGQHNHSIQPLRVGHATHDPLQHAAAGQAPRDGVAAGFGEPLGIAANERDNSKRF